VTNRQYWPFGSPDGSRCNAGTIAGIAYCSTAAAMATATAAAVNTGKRRWVARRTNTSMGVASDTHAPFVFTLHVMSHCPASGG
jgi:hypothetical protein